MTGNIRLKLIALILAALVWYFVSAGDEPIDKLLDVTLVEPEPPANLAYLTDLPDKISLYVKGPRSRIMQIDEANDENILIAEVDVRQFREGKFEYPIHIKGANLRWLEREIIPAKLEIEIEQRDSKIHSPEREVIGGLDPGMEIIIESGLPENVQVSGAKSLIDQVDKVVYQLKETDLIGYVKTNVDFLAVDATGRHITNLHIVPRSVELEIAVQRSGSSRQATVVYEYTGSPPPGYQVASISINPSFIKLYGPPELLREIDRVSTEPIDLTGHSTDFVVPKTLKLKDHADQVRMEPNIVTIEVKIQHKTTSSSFDGLPIQVIGGADASILEYIISPRTVKVTVDGPINEISKLTRGMIVPSVNVGALGEGLHENRQVSVSILNPNISLVKVEPDHVSVTVKTTSQYNNGDEGDTE